MSGLHPPIWNGLGKVATGPSASTVKFYTDDVPKYPCDPAKAKALLKEAGYNGEKNPGVAQRIVKGAIVLFCLRSSF
jgi:ABC-type transport system substrate-binding protein